MFRIVPNENMDEWRGTPLTDQEQRTARVAREMQLSANSLMDEYQRVATVRQEAIAAATQPYDAELARLLGQFQESVKDANALVFQILDSVKVRTEPRKTRRSHVARSA